ncbi:MAG: amidohydrolase family protein [Phycisphaerales bacterium]|nr:amidohydrolase family protein [Phycisphaerales bacterium]
MARHSRLGSVLFVASLLSLASAAPAQPPREPANGPPPSVPRIHALTGARIIVAPGEVIEQGTIVVRDGVIEYVGVEANIPPDARVWDLAGHTIHAGFIDLSVPVRSPDSLPSSPGLHWNSKVRAEFSALNAAPLDRSVVESLHKVGFTAAQIVPDSGIFRGEAATIALVAEGAEAIVHQPHGAQVVQFESGGWRSEGYPGSLIGAVALVRQTFIDADWYAHCADFYRLNPMHLEPPEPIDSLAALRGAVRTPPHPVLFNSSDELDLLRAARLRDEFNLNLYVRGSGEEYQRLGEVLETNLPIVLPLNFPGPPKIEAIEDADSVDLLTLMHWEQAPTNPRRLIEGGATVALTTDSQRNRGKFLDNLRLAMKEGLTEEQALAALTTTPAKILALDKVMGRIEQGMIAHLAVIEGTGELFGKDRTVTALWVNGARIELKADPPVKPQGTWAATIGGEGGATFDLIITGKPESPEVEAKIGETKAKAKAVSWRVERLSFVLPGHLHGRGAWEQYTSVVEGDAMRGLIRTADGKEIAWSAVRKAEEPKEDATDDEADDEADDADDAEEVDEDAEDQKGEEGAGEQDNGAQDAQEPKDKDKDKEEPHEPAPDRYPAPLGAFGLTEAREQPDAVLVRNATVWTSAAAGILEQTDVLIRSGKIAQIGRGLAAPSGAVIIDATGKHLTPGLIDCHSHTGIDRGSINEGTQAITAEVRISDAIDPDDINWYRQLAGGLTIANQLHGSANPIGGQNSVVKIRWGLGPDQFRFEGAKGGIKFALGENVKQANWGDNYTTRYPQSRMGVETLIRSAFLAARDYVEQWRRYNAGEATTRRQYPPRRDLELEALAEILAGERLVHCHSYRQDEILMLIRVADEFGFTLGTFQHILEGYKVASEMAAHGVGGSAFSDWWAYKFEVYDAIPYAGAIMHHAGVLMSFNSDSDELARRMNTEAAKAVRYGGVDPAAAFKFVTINPAKQLAIDDRVGSIEVGKDADFVIWSASPLSTLARCEQTWIDGRQMFSIETDLAMQQAAKTERQRLIQKVLRLNLKDPEKDRKKAEEEKPAEPAEEGDIPSERRALAELMRRRYEMGLDPHSSRPGECGCGLEEYHQ